MKTKKTIPILLLCMLMFCGCGKKEPIVSDIVATMPNATESTVATVPTETESTEPEELSATSEADEVPTVPERHDEITEEAVSVSESKPLAEEANPSNPTVPAETVPTITEPPVTDTSTTEPSVSEATKTAPMETEPTPTEPIVTEPPATVPPETEPEVEVIDTAALESYGRSYASSAYGYNGTSACHPGTGAGYFPAATKKISTMEEGYRIVQQAIDSQYKRDLAYGYTPYEEIDGQTVRCPINVSVTSTGDNTYSITVYYGGTA